MSQDWDGTGAIAHFLKALWGEQWELSCHDRASCFRVTTSVGISSSLIWPTIELSTDQLSYRLYRSIARMAHLNWKAFCPVTSNVSNSILRATEFCFEQIYIEGVLWAWGDPISIRVTKQGKGYLAGEILPGWSLSEACYATDDISMHMQQAPFLQPSPGAGREFFFHKQQTIASTNCTCWKSREYDVQSLASSFILTIAGLYKGHKATKSKFTSSVCAFLNSHS